MEIGPDSAKNSKESPPIRQKICFASAHVTERASMNRHAFKVHLFGLTAVIDNIMNIETGSRELTTDGNKLGFSAATPSPTDRRIQKRISERTDNTDSFPG